MGINESISIPPTYRSNIYSANTTSRMPEIQRKTRKGKKQLPYPNLRQIKTIPAALPHPILLKMNFSGIWTVHNPINLAPEPRIGNFSVSNGITEKIYIGYGTDPNGVMMNDIWEFDLKSKKWKRIILEKQLLPRTNCSATIDQELNLIYVFGGEISGCEYIGQLHCINVNDGRVIVYDKDADNDDPAKRFSPIIQFYKKKIFLWGGSDGDKNLSDLHIFDLLELKWRVRTIDIQGRVGSPWCLYENKIYSYGGSKNPNLLVFDLDEEKVEQESCIGNQPPKGETGACMVKIKNFILYFGGKSQSNWSLFYALDLNRFWWYIFYILPDGVTTTVNDGRINELGLFMLPQAYHLSTGYSKSQRKLFITMGSSFENPPIVHAFSIGEAMCIINLRDDLFESLYFFKE